MRHMNGILFTYKMPAYRARASCFVMAVTMCNEKRRVRKGGALKAAAAPAGGAPHMEGTRGMAPRALHAWRRI